MKAVTVPIGIESPPSAVAMPLSESPNHRLQMMFWAVNNKGLANDMTNEPSIMDQN